MSTPSCEAPLTAANNVQPFFVLHKAAAASVSPLASSRARRRIDVSQPSSPNPKSAKRSRNGDEDDEADTELYEQLRLEAFHRTWSKIQSTINEVLRGINLKLFDQVLQWVQESFSAIRSTVKPCAAEIQQPYPLLTDVICRKIPTAFVLTNNAEFVDDITTFRDLGEHLESNGCHLAKLSATELSAKHGVGGCFRSLLRQLLSDVPEVTDVSALASWYCGVENYDEPIIVIIDDLEQCSGDVLGGLVMMLRHDGTITSFISALKLACSKHFSIEPLSFLCMGMLEEDCENFWRDKFDALPQAMRKYGFGLPSCTSACVRLEDTAKCNFLDIFCEAVNPDLHTQKASNNDLFISKATSENISRGKSGAGRGFIAQAMDTIKFLPMETLFRVLEVWSIHLKGMNEINDKVKELQSTTISANSVRVTKDKWTRRSTSSTGNGTVQLNDKAAMLLDDVTRKFLVPVECLPFHEIICFKNVGILQSALIGNPRRMVQLDLLKSHNRLKCSCCSRNGIAVSASLHDTSIMCNLAQEYGDVINLHDWYLSFDEIINSTHSKVKRKQHSSPSKKKSKVTPPESEAMIQARFCRSVTELQITGLIRMPSKRRPDLVQRIAFGP